MGRDQLTPAIPYVRYRHWVDRNSLNKLAAARTLGKSAHPCSRGSMSSTVRPRLTWGIRSIKVEHTMKQR
ncbi:hypothetical protein TNCV_2427531 [Trichonephila clavipes]|nr:hypothetical protein TNCV_2427531 [Trichonephila clavipes]